MEEKIKYSIIAIYKNGKARVIGYENSKLLSAFNGFEDVVAWVGKRGGSKTFVDKYVNLLRKCNAEQIADVSILESDPETRVETERKYNACVELCKQLSEQGAGA